VGQPLREPPASERRPVLHRARRDREGRAFADPDQKAAQEQRHQAARESGQDRRARPDEAAQKQGPPRPESIADPAAEDLEEEVGIPECRLQKAELDVREPQFLFDRVGRRRNVHAIDVRDQVHQAQEAQDDLRRFQAARRHLERL